MVETRPHSVETTRSGGTGPGTGPGTTGAGAEGPGLLEVSPEAALEGLQRYLEAKGQVLSVLAGGELPTDVHILSSQRLRTLLTHLPGFDPPPGVVDSILSHLDPRRVGMVTLCGNRLEPGRVEGAEPRIPGAKSTFGPRQPLSRLPSSPVAAFERSERFQPARRPDGDSANTGYVLATVGCRPLLSTLGGSRSYSMARAPREKPRRPRTKKVHGKTLEDRAASSLGFPVSTFGPAALRTLGPGPAASMGSRTLFRDFSHVAKSPWDGDEVAGALSSIGKQVLSTYSSASTSTFSTTDRAPLVGTEWRDVPLYYDIEKSRGGIGKPGATSTCSGKPGYSLGVRVKFGSTATSPEPGSKKDSRKRVPLSPRTIEAVEDRAERSLKAHMRRTKRGERQRFARSLPTL